MMNLFGIFCLNFLWLRKTTTTAPLANTPTDDIMIWTMNISCWAKSEASTKSMDSVALLQFVLLSQNEHDKFSIMFRFCFSKILKWVGLCFCWGRLSVLLSRHAWIKLTIIPFFVHHSNTPGLGWIFLANQIAGLPGFGEPTQPVARDNQYGGHSGRSRWT